MMLKSSCCSVEKRTNLVPDSLTFEDIEDTRMHTVMHDQMISNVVQIGKIVKPLPEDPKKPAKIASVLVHIGGEEKGSYTRNWMPWLSSRAGYDAEWWMPEIDEQVVVVAPSGNLALGIIIGMVFRGDWLCLKKKDSEDSEPECEENIPLEGKTHIHRRTYMDGSDISYDRENHALSIQLKEKQEAEKSPVAISAMVKEKTGELIIKLGEEEKEQTVVDLKTGTIDIKAPKGLNIVTGDSVIEMKEDILTLKHGESIIEINKNKITLKSETIELDAGTKLTVKGSGADVA